MDEQSFIRSVRPLRRKSPMQPFRDALMRLSDAGYVGAQLVEFLASNGVNVTVINVHAFLRRERARRARTVGTQQPSSQRANPSPLAQLAGRGAEPQTRPKTLEEIIGSTPDLNAYAESARRNRKARQS